MHKNSELIKTKKGPIFNMGPFFVKFNVLSNYFEIKNYRK